MIGAHQPGDRTAVVGAAAGVLNISPLPPIVDHEEAALVAERTQPVPHGRQLRLHRPLQVGVEHRGHGALRVLRRASPRTTSGRSSSSHTSTRRGPSIQRIISSGEPPGGRLLVDALALRAGLVHVPLSRIGPLPTRSGKARIAKQVGRLDVPQGARHPEGAQLRALRARPQSMSRRRLRSYPAASRIRAATLSVGNFNLVRTPTSSPATYRILAASSALRQDRWLVVRLRSGRPDPLALDGFWVLPIERICRAVRGPRPSHLPVAHDPRGPTPGRRNHAQQHPSTSPSTLATTTNCSPSMTSPRFC